MIHFGKFWIYKFEKTSKILIQEHLFKTEVKSGPVKIFGTALSLKFWQNGTKGAEEANWCYF